MPTLDLDSYEEWERGVTDEEEDLVAPNNNWDESCRKKSPGKEWVCSRDKGHKGPHVATDGGHKEAEVYAVWNQDRRRW